MTFQQACNYRCPRARATLRRQLKKQRSRLNRREGKKLQDATFHRLNSRDVI